MADQAMVNKAVEELRVRLVILSESMGVSAGLSAPSPRLFLMWKLPARRLGFPVPTRRSLPWPFSLHSSPCRGGLRGGWLSPSFPM
jgi:hypothetical protein